MQLVFSFIEKDIWFALFIKNLSEQEGEYYNIELSKP